jgi:hypothetical protein
MSWGAWALVLGLVLAGGTLAWRIYSWRRARQTRLEVRFGRVPGTLDDGFIPVGIEVVNHSDFAARVQDVQLIISVDDDPEPLIMGLRSDGRATIPGTVEPHDSGFIASGVPEPNDDDVLRVFVNVITAVGNVSSPRYAVDSLPPFPAPMRFSRLLPGAADGDCDGSPHAEP